MRCMRKAPKQNVKIAGFVIKALSTGRVLVLRKPNGKWDLPKGHVEDNETFLAGAVRECLEETGFSPDNTLTVYPYHHISIPSVKWLKFFLATVAEEVEPILSDEHDYFDWLDPQDAAHILISRHGNGLSKAVLTICTLAA